MASEAHIIHSAATGSKRARVRAWLKRHPEVFVGLVIGPVLSVILLFVLKQAVARGIVWLACKIAGFISAAIQSIADQFKNYPKG